VKAGAGTGSHSGRTVVVTVLGLMQILAWGSSYYLLAVLAPTIAADTGWPLPWIVGGLSLGLMMAGLVSPRVGRAIDRHGGRPVLAASAVLLALGLCGLAVAPSLPVYLIAWIILGLGMGAGLYDAAFATLGRLYGQGARHAITTLTLFGGFASTACWPLSAYLVSAFGWRGSCLVYAGLHLALALPLYLSALPAAAGSGQQPTGPEEQSGQAALRGATPAPPSRCLFYLLAATITLGSAVSALMSVHLLSLLQERGLPLAAAVALGALVGPSQVGARAIEMAIGRYHHPIWTLMAATVLVALGLGHIWIGLPIIAVGLICYGAGIGIESIARGTLPLVLFGAAGYATLMGRLAMPSLMAQAISPVIGAFLMQRIGPNGTLSAVLGAALVDVGLMIALLMRTRPLWQNSSATISSVQALR
jgi:MFS family permease